MVCVCARVCVAMRTLHCLQCVLCAFHCTVQFLHHSLVLLICLLDSPMHCLQLLLLSSTEKQGARASMQGGAAM